MAYQLTNDPDTVLQLSDGATVPKGHRFWNDYEKWLAAGGKPEPAFTVDPAIPERAWRDVEIESVKWLRERHRDEVDSARPTTLTVEQSGELLDYVQALRDWPQSPKFPVQKYRPKKPGWIAEKSQQRPA
ncbi:phage tail protein [Pseudomonas synxantha]|nr:phage tail protein [Pseudomonas synxantha]